MISVLSGERTDGRPQAPSRIASASSHSRTVESGIDLPVARYSLAPAGASVKRNFRPVVASTLRKTSSAGVMTSGPMPSPASTAMWRALLADMEVPDEDRNQMGLGSETRHARA